MSGYIPAALDAAGEEINPFRASSRPNSKLMMLVASVAVTIADWMEPLTSRLVYASRVTAVASLGVAQLIRRRLGTALVIFGAVISLGIGVILGGAGNSVSASLPGVQTSTHGTSAKDWGELRSALPSGTTGSSSGKSQAPNTPASAGSVVGGGALAGSNTAGPLNGNTDSTSHAQNPSTAPASTGGSPTPSVPGATPPPSGTQPTSTPTTSPPTGGTTPTTRPPTTTTRPPTTTTTPPTTTTTQPPPPTTTTTTPPCTPFNHLLGIC